MPKSLVLGNGNILACYDDRAQLRDLYFHYVGLENHMGDGLVAKIGVFIDDRFSWFDDPSWKIDVSYQNQSLAGKITAKNNDLQLELHFTDIIYNEKNILIRKVEVFNKGEHERQVKLFFNHQFQIYGTNTGNTAYYDPDQEAVIHYKGRRVVLISGKRKDKFFDSFSVGNFWPESDLGTWKDAEDGRLSQNPIEHGLVDSVVMFEEKVSPEKPATFYLWLTVGKSLDRVKELHSYVLDKSPEYLIESTTDFWKAWVNKRNFSFYSLEKSEIDLFKTSLLAMRTHIDNTGAIIASGDSDMLQYGRDTYSYVWPRDGAFIVMSMIKAGYFDIAHRFFEFCKDTISNEGFFYHKYRPDGSLGSSWHPYYKDGRKQLPIQEDETALVIYALWEYYQRTKDLEFIERLYNPLIKKASDFMARYRDQETKLPHPSYDIWEMKYGTSTFSSATVYGALGAAAKFAELLGKEKDQEFYGKSAQEVKSGIKEHLANPNNDYYYKFIRNSQGVGRMVDETTDASSFYGLYKFNILNKDELHKVYETFNSVLGLNTETGGVARFEGDIYYQRVNGVPGNPWFITTLWKAQYLTGVAEDEKGLEEVRNILLWVSKHATSSGLLSEQLHPRTGEQLSASPLAWSHAEYVTTLLLYLERLEELGICKASYSTSI